MPLPIALEFKNLIKEKLKIDYAEVEEAYLQVIQRILRREKIANDQEYELSINRIDEIFYDTSKTEELKILNNLVAEYEDQK